MDKLDFDIANYTVTNESGCCIFLTKKEGMLFLKLIKDKTKDVSKTDIIDFVWGDVKNYEENLIQLIYRLRVKLRKFFSQDYIYNARGFGYIFDKNDKIEVRELNEKILILTLPDEDQHEKCLPFDNVVLSHEKLNIVMNRFNCICLLLVEIMSIFHAT